MFYLPGITLIEPNAVIHETPFHIFVIVGRYIQTKWRRAVHTFLFR
jgi:hypothetical protein